MLRVLPAIPLFQGLDPSHLARLKSLFEPYAAAAGRTVFHQGSPAAYLYVVLAGTVALQYKPDDGPSITITHLRAGDAFGWSAIIGAPAYTSSAICKSNLEAVRVEAAAVRALCREQPEFGELVLERLAKVVSSRWKDSGRQVKAILAGSIGPNQSQQLD